MVAQGLVPNENRIPRIFFRRVVFAVPNAYVQWDISSPTIQPHATREDFWRPARRTVGYLRRSLRRRVP
jgi:hypothetical protein